MTSASACDELHWKIGKWSNQAFIQFSSNYDILKIERFFDCSPYVKDKSWPYRHVVQGHGWVTELAHPDPKLRCVNPPQAPECLDWPSLASVLQPTAGPPMLIGGSEALEGMQISPAVLRYPSVPLPVISNPFIPPDWSRGGRRGEHSCQFVAPSPGPKLCQGTGEGQGVLLLLLPWLGAGLPGPCHVQYIRGDQQASLKVRWHQAHAEPSLNPSSSLSPPPPLSPFTIFF